MCMGIIGGVIIYRQYSLQRWQRMRFHGLCRIPYDTDSMDSDSMIMANREFLDNPVNPDDDDSWIRIVQPLFREIAQIRDGIFDEGNELMREIEGGDNSDEIKNSTDSDLEKFMKEEVELDITDDESYSKINVPQLTTGRGATFFHDFKAEQTGIIDKSAKRCYVMPLDREAVLPPKNLQDLIEKMYSGYYNVDTKVLRKNVRVKVPELTDMTSVSPRISNECKDFKIYELEKLQTGVFKRSITNPATYSEFAGKGFEEINIANLAELEKYENKAANK